MLSFLSAVVLTHAVHAVTPTFSNEVVRIFQEKCQSCHHAGGMAPFPLENFAQAKPRAARIADSVVKKRMPPWKAAADCGEFVGDRSLSQAQIDTIQAWVSGGAPEGDQKDLPAPLTFSTGFQLGTPDLVLKSDRPYKVEAGGDDVYRCFILDHIPTQDEYISVAEFLPDKAAVVHHGLLYLDPDGESPSLLTPNDPQPGYTCFGGPGLKNTSIIGGWSPGQVYFHSPKGIGTQIPKGARIVMQIHYHPNGTEQMDHTPVGLFFSKDPVSKPLLVGGLLDKSLVIPANDPAYTVSTELTLPVNMKLTNILPHMHLLGKKISVEAILPDNTKQCLIRIDNWDFHWQGFYYFKNMISLPKGTRLKMTGVYDNSSGNHHNPNNPPKEVKWGDRTVDEMFLSFFSFILD